jgi:hypothetical protein
VYRAVVVHDTVTNASTALNASITCAPAGPGLTAANAALCADLATVLASTDEDVSAPTISGNGRFVAYVVHDVGTPRQVLVHDRQTGTTRIASVAPDGGGPHPECEDHGGYLSYASFDPALSDDGSVIVFTTACEQPYVVALDLTDGTMVDVRPAPGVAASQPDVSGDGRFVAVVTGVDNADDDGVVAVFDRQEGTFAELLATGRHPAVDEHGVRVVFQSTRAIGDGSREVILSATASPAQVTVVSMPLDGMAPNGDSVAPAIADDGGVAAWSSLASDLIAGDTNDAWDVFVRALD